MNFRCERHVIDETNVSFLYRITLVAVQITNSTITHKMQIKTEINK